MCGCAPRGPLSSRACRRPAAGTGSRRPAAPGVPMWKRSTPADALALVTRTSSRAPRRERPRAEQRVQVHAAARRARVRLVRLAGSRAPVQRTSIVRARREAAWPPGVRLRVPAPAFAQRRIEPGSGGNGSMHAVAVLVDGVADDLARARVDRRRRRRRSPAGAGSRRRRGRGSVASTPEQSSSTPLSGMSTAPGWIAGLVSLQSAGTADAVEVGVALDLLARDAGVGVVGDRRVVPVAAVDLLGAAVAGDDVVVARCRR